MKHGKRACRTAIRGTNSQGRSGRQQKWLRKLSFLMICCLVFLSTPAALSAEETSGQNTLQDAGLQAVSEPQARLIFTFDDGLKGQIDNALPILTTAGFKATAYVNKRSVVGTNPLYMRLGDLQTLYAAGWDIGNHTVTHDSTTETDPLTLARLTSEYLDNQNWLIDNVGERGARHICYPSGSFSTAYLPIFRSIGSLTGRTTVQYNLTTPVADPAEYFELPIKSVSSTSAGSISRTMTAIDNAVTEGKTIILMLHNVQPEVGSLTTTIADFQLIVDRAAGYVSQHMLKVVTMSEWYDEQSAIVPPQPVTPPAPELILDDTANTVSGITCLMEYRLDSQSPDTPFTGWDELAFYQNGLTGDHTLEVRYKASGIHPSGLVSTLLFTGLADPPPPTARVIFTFDDGWKDQYTNAFPIMQKAGFPAVAYINRDSIIGSNPVEMRTADLRILYAAGWDIGNHTTNHDSTTLTDLETLARLTTEYLDNQTWIEQTIGLRGARHACYPSGSYMPEYVTLLQGIGALSARTTDQANIVTPVTDPEFFYRLPIKSVSSNPGSIDRTKEAIDAAVRDGTTVILMLHKIEPEPGSLITTTADLQLLVDYVTTYVSKQQLEVMTMTQWYYEQTGTPQPQPEQPPLPAVYHDDIDNRVFGMAYSMEYRLDGGNWIPYDPTEFAGISFEGDHALDVRFAAVGINPAGLIKTMQFTPNEPNPEPVADAKILFTFDGDWKGQLDYALPILNAAGFQATTYIMRDATEEGDPDLMTLEDLRILNENGWDIGNHTATHNDDGALTDPATLAALRQDYEVNQQWIIDQIGSRGAWHVAYPSGKYSEPLIDILKDIGVRTARTTHEENQVIPITDAHDFYTLPCEPFSSDPRYTDVKSVKQAVDDAVNNGSTVIIFMNQVLPDYVDGNVTIADLQTVVDYVKAYADQGQVSVMTISEWYQWQIAHFPVDGALPDPGDPEDPVDPPDPPDDPPIPAGNVLFTFDRGWKSQYSNAFPILQTAGFKATSYVCRDYVLNPKRSWMSLSNLRALQAEGWDIGNMTTNYNTSGATTSSKNLQKLLKSYQDNQSFLRLYLDNPGINHVAYPGGAYTDRLIQGLQAQDVVSGRTLTNGFTDFTDTRQTFQLPIVRVTGSAENLAAARAAVERAASEGLTVILQFEKIENTTDSLSIRIADFQSLVNLVTELKTAGRLNVKTISECYDTQQSTVAQTQPTQSTITVSGILVNWRTTSNLLKKTMASLLMMFAR